MIRKNRRNFFVQIILPTILAFLLFTVSIFSIIIPTFRQNILDRKREMIREITNTAWSILDEFHRMEQDGQLTRVEAQQQARAIIQYLRYGEEQKDYFWVTDMQPVMIVHPYRPELNNSDLSDYQDPEGKRLFVEFVNKARASGEGYVDYMWQWKDDPSRIVPKLSFVKAFAPWGWIIGTGIYIEDVKAEIGNLTRNLISVSFIILVVLAIILFYVGRQSLNIERERHKAISSLRQSEAKYRELVEASTEGLVMLLDGEYVYANKTLLAMLGYHDQSWSEFQLDDILCEKSRCVADKVCYFAKLKNEGYHKSQLETRLRTRDGEVIDVILYTSEIILEGKKGYTIIVKDLSRRDQMEGEPGQGKNRFQTLIDQIDIGVFRTGLGYDARVLQANAAAIRMLGFMDNQEMSNTGIVRLFHHRPDARTFLKKLTDEGVVENMVVQVRKKSGDIAVVSISAVLVRDDSGEPLWCDGILQDITGQIRLEEERENLIIELQTSLRFLNEPVEHFAMSIVACNMNWPIFRVAKVMTRKKYSAALLMSDDNEYIGIISDRDLRERVVAESYDVNRPAREVMSSPIVSIPSTALVYHTLMFMHEKGIRHLAVKDREGNIIGTISSEELLQVHRQSSTFLLREIEMAESVDDLIAVQAKVPRLVKALIDSGARARNITQTITTIFDAVLDKLIEFAVADMGAPPARYAFLALGSIGRKEQTLISDQDNAILYEDVAPERAAQTRDYFLQLAKRVCDGLNACGYVYCKGEAMAMNPRWCQPLSQWQEYFHTWITQSNPQDLIDLSIFFDFRCVHGDGRLAGQLREYLFKTAEGQSGFMQHLMKNSLQHRLPLGLLGRIVVESKGDHPETFDVKNATLFLIDYARIYAIRDKIHETNTLERLQGILQKGIINKTTYDELLQAYHFLMQLRFKHHSAQMARNEPANNFINPGTLTQIERNTLKHTFAQISSIQKKLNYDFSGEAI